jgi:glycosyltransferase involved in cell wall biosynthesis
VTSSAVHLVPISLLGPARPERTWYLHDRLGISRETHIVLLLGQIHAQRSTIDAVKAAQSLPAGWMLVVHGPAHGDDALLQHLASLNTSGRARISTDLVAPRELTDLVASADVGLVLYAGDTPNDYLTGRSSEKVARYAQAGVPMIAFDYPSFLEVFDRFECGRCIEDLNQLVTAIHAIEKDYARHRAGALRAYEDVYEFSKQFSPVLDWIDRLG